METGATAEVTWTVTESDTAIAQGSGSVPVFATPRLVALCEAAAVASVAPMIGDEQTTVGARIEIDHLAPSVVGATVSATATLTEVDGRRLTFEVIAHEGEKLIGRGTHDRVAIDEARFLASLP